MWVDANGIIYFDEKWQGSSPFINDPMPTSDFATLVAPFWDSLEPFGTGSDNNVFWDVIGTAPNQELVIEWRNVKSGTCVDPGTIRFQTVFFENSSDVLFNYADTFFGGECWSWFEYGGSASVGIQVSSSVGTQLSFNEPSLSDGLALRWTLSSLTFSPSSLDFGGVRVGTTSAPQAITLTNSGNQAVTISDIAASGDFAQTSTCGSSLAASASCTIEVTFTPTAAGTRTGELTINSDAPGSPHTVALSGNGTVLAVTLSPTSLSFGNQALGATSAPQTVTLTNTGNAPLTISGITASGDFAQTNDCPSPLGAGAHCTINVTFTPAAAGPRKTLLSITDNAAGSPHKVLLTGIGTAVRLSPSSLNFPDQEVGTSSAPSPITVTNLGSAPVNLWEVAITGANSGDFSLNNTCPVPPATLAGGASCTISVTFTPTAAGTRVATLLMSDDGGGSPHAVSLTGTGALPLASLSPELLSFSAQPIGTSSAAQGVRLSNLGTTALRIRRIDITGTNSRDFAMSSDCGSSLQAGAACSIHVTIAPRGSGRRYGTLTVTYGRGGPKNVQLAGVGVGPRVGPPNASVVFHPPRNR